MTKQTSEASVVNMLQFDNAISNNTIKPVLTSNDKKEISLQITPTNSIDVPVVPYINYEIEIDKQPRDTPNNDIFGTSGNPASPLNVINDIIHKERIDIKSAEKNVSSKEDIKEKGTSLETKTQKMSEVNHLRLERLIKH